MMFVQKCSLIVPFEELNKYLLSSAAFLLAAKSMDEPISLAALAETYCILEQCRNKREGSTPGKVSDWLREEYERLISGTEFDILCNVGFDCELELPSTHIAQFCKE